MLGFFDLNFIQRFFNVYNDFKCPYTMISACFNQWFLYSDFYTVILSIFTTIFIQRFLYNDFYTMIFILYNDFYTTIFRVTSNDLVVLVEKWSRWHRTPKTIWHNAPNSPGLGRFKHFFYRFRFFSSCCVAVNALKTYQS